MITTDNVLDAGDVLIVGAGLAGLFAALKLSPRPVTVLANAPLGAGAASAWAQGGIAAAIGEGDSIASHVADTIAAGAGLVDAHMAQLIASEAPKRIEDLVKLAVPFDRDAHGQFALGREGAHHHNRIVRVSGDRAGAAIMDALRARVIETPSIRVLSGLSADTLAVEDGRVVGVFVPNWAAPHEAPLMLRARHIVLATGGIGALYRVTTNPREALGEGLAMAARAGAAIADAEFVQFHPTAIDVGRDPAPLASEALRGEGAFLVNDQGTRFMANVHEMADLAPRDIVARAIHSERAKGHRVYLDARDAIGAAFPSRFPTITKACAASGIDPATDLIPVAPAAHYHMGGVATDDAGRSTLDGLWACGEVASTGVHGANRLASNSLLETVVMAARVAEDIDGAAVHPFTRGPVPAPRYGHADALMGSALTQALRKTMDAHVGVVRSKASLTRALDDIAALEAEAAQTPGTASALANLFTTARLVTDAALARKDSRGGHFREDFPKAREEFAHRMMRTVSADEQLMGAAHV